MSELTEFQKMRSQQLYYYSDQEVDDSIRHAQELCARMTCMTVYDPNYRPMIEELIPGIDKSSVIIPPFHIDHGTGITIGPDTFINYNCTILDGAYVKIGRHVLMGPNCSLYTPQHPKDYTERREPKETSYPITIGDDTWLCGGVTVCPGVTIGSRCIIAAGSVVTKDIPDDCLAAGNPAVVKRRLK